MLSSSEGRVRARGGRCNRACGCVGLSFFAAAAGAAEPDALRTCLFGAERRPLLPNLGPRRARQLVDGVPLDVDVTLPESGSGPFPTIVMLHGFGGSKKDFESTSQKARLPTKPAAVRRSTTTTATTSPSRGTWSSTTPCAASATPAVAGPAGDRSGACGNGYIRLADTRYEARDTQYLLGLLADEGLVKPRDIGVTGISYGGGQSMELAFLPTRSGCRTANWLPGAVPTGRR